LITFKFLVFLINERFLDFLPDCKVFDGQLKAQLDCILKLAALNIYCAQDFLSGGYKYNRFGRQESDEKYLNLTTQERIDGLRGLSSKGIMSAQELLTLSYKYGLSKCEQLPLLSLEERKNVFTFLESVETKESNNIVNIIANNCLSTDLTLDWGLEDRMAMLYKRAQKGFLISLEILAKAYAQGYLGDNKPINQLSLTPQQRYEEIIKLTRLNLKIVNYVLVDAYSKDEFFKEIEELFTLEERFSKLEDLALQDSHPEAMHVLAKVYNTNKFVLEPKKADYSYALNLTKEEQVEKLIYLSSKGCILAMEYLYEAVRNETNSILFSDALKEQAHRSLNFEYRYKLQYGSSAITNLVDPGYFLEECRNALKPQLYDTWLR
jgi:hypothetical protein